MTELFPGNKSLPTHRIIVPDIVTKSVPVYPSVWFTDHPNQKPEIAKFDNDAASLCTGLKIGLNNHRWDDRTVSSFMLAVISENEAFRVTTTEAWTANGITVAQANEAIDPTSLLNITDGGHLEGEAALHPTDKEARLSLFWALVMVYRKAKAVGDEGRITITFQLNDFFIGNNFNVTRDDIYLVCAFVSKDNLTKGYCKVIAALDMFFYKFPSHPFAKSRKATLPSRYMGCATLATIGHISKIVGLPVEDFALFIFTSPVAKELANVSKTGEGAEDVYGYFPYQIDLGLTEKSPYSVNANPTLYLWLHTIGTLMLSPRSMRAIYLSGASDVVATVTSAAAVALALFKGSAADEFRERERAPRKRCTRTLMGEFVEKEGEDEQDHVPIEGIPAPPVEEAAAKANEVLSNLKKTDGRLTELQTMTLRRRLVSCGTLKNGTIGKYLSGLFSA